jgi:hypothetical protein
MDKRIKHLGIAARKQALESFADETNAYNIYYFAFIDGARWLRKKAASRVNTTTEGNLILHLTDLDAHMFVPKKKE